MPEIQQFRLPDAGEGLTEAEIVTWRVRPGDTIKVYDPIVEIETAKSLVELPSPYAGVVTELLVPEGVTVDVGTPIIAVDTDPSATPGGSAPLPEASPEAPPGGEDPTEVQIPPAEGAVEPGMIGGPAPGGRTSVLVGYGPRTTAAVRRARTRPPRAPEQAVVAPAPPAPSVHAGPVAPPAPVEAPEPIDAPAARAHVLAKPPVRKLAKDLGVDITTVAPSGPNGVITREDVERAVPGVTEQPAPAATRAATGERETRIPIKGVRRRTADAMVASAFTAPHVTEWVTVDVTRTMKLVERLRTDREFAEVKVSPLLILAKALVLAVRPHPRGDAARGGGAPGIVIKHHLKH